MTAPVLLLSQWSEPVVSWGIEVAAKALLCGLLVYLVHLAVGRRRVLVRSVLWNAALVGLLVLPAAIAFCPRWNLAVWPSQPVPKEMTLRVTSVDDIVVPRAAAVVTEPMPERAKPTPILRLVVCGVYLLGICVGLARFARGLHGIAKLRRESVSVENACWMDALAYWRRELGLPKSIGLLHSERVSVPLVMGARSPVVIVPRVLADAADRQTIDAVLLHELAHIGRHDFAWNLLLKLVQTMYWFHPIGWCLGKFLHQAREDSCDAVCIHWLGGPREYVSVLVELVVSYLPRPAAALGLGMTRTSRLSRRLRRIADSVGSARYALGGPLRGLSLAAIGAGVVVLGSMQLTQRAVAQERVIVSPPVASGTADNKPQVREVDLYAADDTEDIIEVTRKRERDAVNEKRLDQLRRNAQDTPEEVATRTGKKVAVVKVREGMLQQTEKQPCSLVGYEPLQIYPRVSGVVVKTVANVGDVVKQGQILAVTEVPDAEAQIARARGGVARAETELAKAEVQLEASQAAIDTAKAQVGQTTAEADATLAYQKKQYERIKGLAEHKAIDERLLDESEEKLSAAKADVKATHAKIAASKAQLLQAEADAKVKQAFVQAAKIDMSAAKEAFNVASMALLEDNRVVRAPADGIIAECDADIGQAVGADKPMFVLNSYSVIAARVYLPESVVLQAKKGMSALIKLDAQPRVQHEGTVTQLAYNIDPTTRTLRATVAIPNPEGKLRPGMYGSAEIVLSERTMPVVPETAVLTVTEKQITSWYCYKWAGAHFVRVKVSRHHVDGKQCAIAEGLQVGDEVALDAKSVFSKDRDLEPQDE